MSAERHKLRRKVEQLKAYQGRHSSFTTIYVPPSKNLTDVISFVKSELAGAENIKSKANRKHVSDNLTAILSELTKIDGLPDNGLAFFYGVEEEGGTEREIRELVVPPIPISQFIYLCGREFVTEELENMTKPKSLVVIVLIEGGKVTVGYLRGKHMELIRDEDFYIIGKTRAGGQSAKRYMRLREEKMMEFFKFVGRLLNTLLLDDLENVDAIVLGGNTIRAQEFLEKGDLDYRLREKVAETIIPVSIIDETGLYQAMKEASRVLRETEIYAERQAWDSFIEDLMKGLNTVTYGKKEVMDAMREGRVDTIMVLEDLSDQMDELYDEVTAYGSKLMVFSNQTESGAQLKSFGGMAARLRW
ncbi:MAG: Peptide chain release factor subunit 1 [Candidatus Thorarchaeota archaeon AB_25]|nr:MAG: Peptide chain release factor subunit 1 [Candidatus Thorarchaeota archaeon AB_25]